MDWLTDDEMMRQSEEVGKYDEELTVKRSEGGKPHMEKAHSAQQLVVAQAQMKKSRARRRGRW